VDADETSPDRRVAAGRRLAAEPDLGPVSETLLALLLDRTDTAVIAGTAEALLDRHDESGLALVLRAAGRVDESVDAETLDHLNGALTGLAYSEGLETVYRRCVDLLDGADEELSRGARWQLHR
jgi:hypothetical protein